MKNAQISGVLLLIVGGLSIVVGYPHLPSSWWQVGGGVALILVGLFRLVRGAGAIKHTA